MRRFVFTMVLGGSFGLIVLAHVLIAVRLARVKPRYRALLVWLWPPLAPAWAHAKGWRRLRNGWLLGVFVYTVTVATASLLGG